MSLYRSVVTLKQLTEDVVEVHAAAALFTSYLRLHNLPVEYHTPLQEHETIWTYCRTTLGADYPEQMRYEDWETDTWTDLEGIRQIERRLFPDLAQSK